jgi:hypothetical protein
VFVVAALDLNLASRLILVWITFCAGKKQECSSPAQKALLDVPGACTNSILTLQKPEGVQHLRIMYQGKILQDVLTISDLKQLPGDIVPERLVTLHLMLAPPGQLTGASNSRRPHNERSDSSCCCVQ